MTYSLTLRRTLKKPSSKRRLTCSGCSTTRNPRPWCWTTKPNLGQVMRDLSVLLAASRLLNEPIYIFGDDAKDYFNQLAVSPEAWHQLGVVFLRPKDVARKEESSTARLFFVSERRLGFGAKISSNIAQRFSESLLFMLRQDMAAAEARLPRDDRPSAIEWRRVRGDLCEKLGHDRSCFHSRLWFVHMYTDDPILGVVGVERALLLLECWYKLTRRVGLIMAIPEKRNLGTWAPWLGVILCAGLGVVLVPKPKLQSAGCDLKRLSIHCLENARESYARPRRRIAAFGCR